MKRSEQESTRRGCPSSRRRLRGARETGCFAGASIFGVILHFSAVIAAATVVGPAPGYAQAVWQLFHPYLQALFLNHGFNFFAPEPSPSTLMDFEAVRADGSTVKGRIPERSIWPGLLYERHLLLTEHIGVVPEGDRDEWYRSYARHLCRKYGAKKVHLVLLTHFPLEMDDVRARRAIG